MDNNENYSQSIFVYGAGGHAKVIIDILQLNHIEVAAVLDDNPELNNKTCMGYPISTPQKTLEKLHEKGIQYGIIAIGNNKIREEKGKLIRSWGYDLITAIHPSTTLARTAEVGKGTAVMAGVIVNSDSVIGENVTLNTGCTIDHDCRIGNCAHISPGVHLGGTVTIGERTHIGIGAAVLPNLTIGKDVMVGGGAVVIHDLPDGVTAVGVPAKIIQSK